MKKSFHPFPCEQTQSGSAGLKTVPALGARLEPAAPDAEGLEHWTGGHRVRRWLGALLTGAVAHKAGRAPLPGRRELGAQGHRAGLDSR